MSFAYHRSTHTRCTLFLTMLLALLLTACNSGDQEDVSDQRFTVGLVIPHPIVLDIYDKYRLEMAELGYIEGENLTYIEKGPPENFVELLQYPGQLVEADVDLILVVATEGALLVQGATQDIPIVFVAGDAPVEAGLAESLNKPGGNITGVMTTGPEARRLELLLEIVPDIHTLYVPHTPGDVMAERSFREIVEAAEAFGLELITQNVLDETEVFATIQNIPEEADGIFIPQSLLVATYMEEWANEAIARKLPLSTPGVGDAEASELSINPLMGYGLSVHDLAIRAARLTDQILRGANPGDVPIEAADFYLMVNLDTADAIGVEIPEHVLEQAHFINHIRTENGE